MLDNYCQIFNKPFMINLNNIVKIEDFISSGNMRLLYLSRPDCGVCQALIPKIEDMILGFPDLDGRYIDLDQLPEAAGKYSIFTIPGILVFIQGKETIRKARYVSVEELKTELKRYDSLLKA